MAFFDWLFSKSKKQKELEEKQKADARRQLEQEAEKQKQLQAIREQKEELQQQQRELQQRLHEVKALEEKNQRQQREQQERNRQIEILRLQLVQEKQKIEERKTLLDIEFEKKRDAERQQQLREELQRKISLRQQNINKLKSSEEQANQQQKVQQNEFEQQPTIRGVEEDTDKEPKKQTIKQLRIESAREQERIKKIEEENKRQLRIRLFQEDVKNSQQQSEQQQRTENSKISDWITKQQLEVEKAKQERQDTIVKQQKLASENQDIIYRNFCESNTDYCFNLNRLYDINPKNFKFATIRSLTSDCGVWHELENGVKQLETYDQLEQYIFTYGLMHQAKLYQAYHLIFTNNHLILSGQPIEIIDYGCGQAIGTICLIDYIKEQTNSNCNIATVKLIEPSILALKRAVLHTRYSLKSFDQTENIFVVNKELNDINQQDLKTQNTTVKIHIFSNIIDVEDFDLYELYHKIQATQTGMNIFVCVSPNIMKSRNQRLDRFQQYFANQQSFISIGNRESDIPNPKNPDRFYKRYERIFKVHLGESTTVANRATLTHPRRFVGDDDLPF